MRVRFDLERVKAGWQMEPQAWLDPWSLYGHFNFEEDLLVYGLSVTKGEFQVQILSSSGYLLPLPLKCFDITDNRMSRYWRLSRAADETIRIWPQAFYAPFFHDDLSDGKPQSRIVLQETQELLELEDSQDVS